MILLRQVTIFPIYRTSEFFFQVVKNKIVNQEIQQGGVEFQLIRYYIFLWNVNSSLLLKGRNLPYIDHGRKRT
jgi:hypothetical protein